MPFEYSDPSRQEDLFSLPNIEVFYAESGELADWYGEDATNPAGYYYWACLPGCLPDGEPIGPFATHGEALQDARDNMEDGEVNPMDRPAE